MLNDYDLSIIIPARNEMFLANTVEDILKNKRGKTEVIVVLDGEWPEVPLENHQDVKILFYPESIGQRAATNQGVKLSRAKYIMKVDAHCAFDEGFDVKLMADMQDDWTLVPSMKNLHAFDWVCDKCGKREYQDKTHPCPDCGSTMHREMVWKPRRGVHSRFFRFDKTLHFQYWNEYKHRPEAKEKLAETMSIQGSCFMVTREKYWELDLCDEGHGSWGQQGVEVAMKTWMSGGRVMNDDNTWYAHMFRTQGGDFGFPYPNPGIGKARKYSQDLWFNNKWPLAKHDLAWLLEKFDPVPDWDVSVGILYYTNNNLDPALMKACQDQLREAADQKKIVSVSLKETEFGDDRYVLHNMESSPITMFKQILYGLEHMDTDVVFFCESDVLYHPSHFEFIPPEKEMYYYNNNCWQVRQTDKFAVKYDCKRLSQLCAYRETLIKHYKERIRRCEAEGFSRRMGFEPGSHGRPERVDDIKSGTWESKYPNCDIRHDRNMTASRWKQSEFRSQRSCRNWQEGKIPSWAENLI